MVTIGSFNAKTHLPQLLKRVAKGETIQISKRGIPVARLVPILDTKKTNPQEIVRQIRQMRKGITLGNINLHKLINQGRP